MLTFIRLCLAVEHRLMTIKIPPTHLDTPQDPEIFVYEAARIAALMSSTHLFRKMRSASPVHMSLQQRLRKIIASFEAQRTSCLGQDCAELLLWALCVGTATAVDPLVYEGSLCLQIELLGLRGWNELRKCLEKYLWTESMHKEALVSMATSVPQ